MNQPLDLDAIEAKAAELRTKIDRKNPWPSDNESFSMTEGWKNGTRNALNKLLNSLSWHPRIRVAEPVEATKTVLRIDLRWYLWDATLWNRVLNDYPYGVLDDSTAARAVAAETKTKMPLLRADWFVATASRAPLYYDVLQLPGNLTDLERQIEAREHSLWDLLGEIERLRRARG